MLVSAEETTKKVEQLLRESMQAHDAARMARQRRGLGADDLLRTARDKRLAALELDPERKSQAWLDEVVRLGRDLHVELLSFYDSKVTK